MCNSLGYKDLYIRVFYMYKTNIFNYLCNLLVIKGLYIRVFYMCKTHIFNALDGVDNFFLKIFGNIKYFSYLTRVNVPKEYWMWISCG